MTTRPRYDRVSILLHWATLALLIGACASIEARVLFEKGTETRLFIKESHYVLGMALLLLALARLANRAARRNAAPTPPAPAWLGYASRAMHWALYACLIALPCLGLLTTSALGDAVPLGFGLEFPAMLGQDKELGKQLQAVHTFIGGTLYVLVGLHAAAALGHHFVLRDGVRLRMTPSV